MSDDGEIIYANEKRNIQVTIFTLEGRPTIRVRKGAQHINLELDDLLLANYGMGLAHGVIAERNKKDKRK